MIRIEDIMDVTKLGSHIADGYISVRHHPQFPQLVIYNYTAKTQYDGLWDELTTQCRGLIVDNDTGEIVARPVQKFYNYGDTERIDFNLDGSVEVTEKMDGSMITVSLWNENVIVASRGSFESDHAYWARDLIGDFYPMKDFTYVFELIHPENRIVVDYGDRKELVLLTIVDNETGLDGWDWNAMFKKHSAESKQHAWRGNVVKRYNFNTLDKVLNSEEVKNMEGFVVKFKPDGQRLKIKFPEYVKLHKIMTNFSELAIWEVMSTGGSLDDWLTNVPDEFYAQVQQVRSDLYEQYLEWLEAIEYVYNDMHRRGLHEDRKAFAAEAVKYEYASALFGYLDGRKPKDWIWKRIRPKSVAMQRPEGNVYRVDDPELMGSGERPIIIVKGIEID